MAQRLSLTTTSLQNVIISNATDRIYYEVVTPHWEPTVTRVSKKDPKSHELEVVAELQNEGGSGTSTLKPTAVRLRGQQFRPETDFWTKDGKAGSNAKFRGKDGKHYSWRVRKGRLELIKDDDAEQKPVAVYHRTKRLFLFMHISHQPYLEVQPSVMETLDSLIVSFLLMERKRRDGAGEKA